MSQLSDYDRWKLANPPEWDEPEPPEVPPELATECLECRAELTDEEAISGEELCTPCLARILAMDGEEAGRAGD